MKYIQLIKQLLSTVKGQYYLGLLLVLIVWFLLPHIKINDSYPFSSMSARIVMLFILGIVLFFKQILSFIQTHKDKSFSVIAEKTRIAIRAIGRMFKLSWGYGKSVATETKYKISRDKRKRKIRKLPWYLVLGGPQSGKKSVIKNTGLSFVRPEHFGEEAVNYINQFPDFEWWFSEKSVLIDPMTYDAEADMSSWKRFVKLLKRERKNKPLSGIILPFSMIDLMQYSNQARQDFIQSISLYIREIYSTFKSLVPVYFVFTKCDLVEGFLEFFNDMSKEELRQVWGMTFPIQNCNDLQSIQTQFHQKYADLVGQLNKRIMWSMSSEKSPRGRELIHAFPQQMQLLEKPIQHFIVELFGAVRYHQALQVRGVYFTSCNQNSGDVQDFVLQALSKKYQFSPPQFQRMARHGECYFMHSLFYNVILPESQVLGDSERAKKIRRISYNGFLAACPVVILLTATGMYAGYNENKANLKLINQHIDYYQTSLSNIKENDDSLYSVLPAINQIHEAQQLYTNSGDWGLHFLYETDSIKGSISDAQQRALHSLFLPRIAAQIESRLNKNISDQNLLYATLKGYLAFSDTSHTGRDAIKVPMEHAWNNEFLSYPDTRDQLRYYLGVALQKPVEKLPLDEPLVSRIRGELEQIIPSQRAYGLLTLRASVSNLPNLIITTAVGSDFDKIFTIGDQANTIPALYTRSGYKEVFLPNYEKISEEVARDNNDIGLKNNSDETQTADQINHIIQRTYNQRYQASWDNALSSITVKAFSNLNDAVNSLNLLVSHNSPLIKLLNVVYDNTSPVTHDKVQVASTFSGVNEFTRGDSGDVSWNKISDDLKNVRDYLVKLQQASNQNEMAFNQAKAAMQGAKSPIQALSFDAQKTDPIVRTWLNAIANNCWAIVAKGAREYINDAWKNNIDDTYRQNIRGRYPINRDADSQIAIQDFNTFFGNGGELELFFNQYIQPFINTDKSSWIQYNVNGHSIGLPDQTVHIFERAKIIRDEFFSHGAKTTSFSFTVKPLTLTANASSIQFTVGGQSIVYSHGPQQVNDVSWPMPFNNQDSSIVITGFDSNQYSKSASGPWSLYRIFDYGVLKPTDDNGTYVFDINFDHYTASYEITGADNINIFRLAALKGFSLPDLIAPDNSSEVAHDKH